MNPDRTYRLLVYLALLGLSAAGQTLNVPPRPPGAPTGSQAVSILTPLSLINRENWIYDQIMTGNVPNFLRTLVPVSMSASIGGSNHTCTYYAAPDYLALGTDEDYFLAPMTPLLGQRLCDALGCTLPTRKMVNQIWTNAAVKMPPQPITASPAMTTVPVFADHNYMVRTQRNLTTNAFPLGALVSGNKKDVVISTRIYTNFATAITEPVVIYGWHQLSGSPIQPLYNGHEETYADYSHGIRLVQNAITLNGQPASITEIVRDPNLAALLSDEGPAEGTAAGVIQVPRYGGSIGPAILIHPRSRRLSPGSTADFSVTAASTNLSYRWLFNGSNVAGATAAMLVIPNIQPVHAGHYAAVVSNNLGTVTSRSAWLRVVSNAYPILFADDFENNSATNWNIFWGAANGIADYTVQWSYQYTGVPYLFHGVSNYIPPAPGSPNGAARGVRLTVNDNDGNAATAGVNIYPKAQVFSGNFSLKVDMWLNYPGPAGGSPGSTEHAIFGVNHLGTQVNWSAPTAASSDGLWFAVSGDGDDTRDYRAYLGNPGATQTELIGTAASGLSASNNSAAIYQGLFSGSRFESAGVPGKNWVEVELRYTNNFIFWLLDGTVVAQRTNASTFNSGNLMLGLMDPFSSISNPAADSFVLFDNVRVEDLSGRPKFLDANRESTGQVRLVISGVPGLSYWLEASTNFTHWDPVVELICTNSPMQVLEHISAPSRLYRVRQ